MCKDFDETKCKICQDGYHLDSNDTVCKINIDNCKELDSLDKSKCGSCDVNYVLTAEYKCKCKLENC